MLIKTTNKKHIQAFMALGFLWFTTEYMFAIYTAVTGSLWGLLYVTIFGVLALLTFPDAERRSVLTTSQKTIIGLLASCTVTSIYLLIEGIMRNNEMLVQISGLLLACAIIALTHYPDEARTNEQRDCVV